jgi:hypothetical protein
MESINNLKINTISKKSLKVAVKEPNNVQLIETQVEPKVEPKIEDLEEEPKNIQAQKLTKKGKIETRGKADINKANLEKGRAKLVETWAEKRRVKEELQAAALEKKVNLAIKQKQLINKAYGVTDEEVWEVEEDEEPIIEELVKKKIITSGKPKVVSGKAEVEKKPKKKVIKYVEESESEEEEIVYVKKSKTQKQEPMQQVIPKIIFY